MMMTDYLPINYLNHLVYCPRRFWYMYVQGEIAINAPMLEGSLQHAKRADKPGRDTDDRGRNVQRRVWVWSDTLKIAGLADFVESDGERLIPVERKHGAQGRWQNDEVQLCAQALCLEEMTGQEIPQGEIFYWRSRKRQTVELDLNLRNATRNAIEAAWDLIEAEQTPAPVTEEWKCTYCSIEPICLPTEVKNLKASDR